MFITKNYDNIIMKIFDEIKTVIMDKSARAAAKKTLSLMLLVFCVCCVKLCAEDTSPAEAQVMREKFVTESKKYVGSPYVLGAVGPDTFDCSGLVYHCSREALKKQLPRTAKALYNYCRIVPDKDKEIGDLLFFKTNNTAPITHVGIYIGNNQFISAISDGPNTGVIISSLKQEYWKPKYVACGQFLPSGKSKANSGASGNGSGSGTNADDFEEEDFTDENENDSKTAQNNVNIKGSSFYNPDAKGLEALVADASVFCDWSLFAPNSFMIQWRGIDVHTNIRYSKWILEPGLGLAFRYNYGLGIFQMPILFTATVTDYFRFYAGPVISFGNPKMDGIDEDIKASVFPGIIGFSFATPALAISDAKFQVVQDISYTIFNRADNSALSFTDSIAAGLVFFTGVRVTLGIGKLFK